MIKRTPQEIADFFGCNIAMDKNGFWFMYKNKPHIRNDKQWITDNPADYESFSDDYIDWDGDWTKSLHSPQKSKPEGLTGHHNEQVLIEEEQPKKERTPVDYILLSIEDNDIQDWFKLGYELYGNPYIDKDGTHYQAMIKRG